MINKNYAEDIRKCERIKFDQALYILTMYEKKIRKSSKLVGSNGVIDAETEMQDIISSWKNKWKMDLTKPILNCVTSVYPRVLIDLTKHNAPQLTLYYSLINKFLSRLRTEHEDETNFKLVMQVYDRQVEYGTTDKYLTCSKATVKGFLLMARDLTGTMIAKMEENADLVANEMLDVSTDNLQWQAYRPLRYVHEISKKALIGEQGQMEVENDIEPKCEKTQNLIAFSSNVVKLMEKIKESEHGSTLITVQPKIDELTLLVHPLLIAISANFKKQNLQKVKDYDWSKAEVESVPMMENLKSSYNSSKIVFINLDGYESEFNLQVARNFKKHLLYISFPKEDAKLDDVKQIYSRRFFKKLMFRYSQNLYESYDNAAVNADYKMLTRMDRLNFNPQDYHCATQRLYDHKNDKGNDDFNQNLYVFPLRMSILYQKFPQVFESRQDIENHESYFIRFVLKDFLLNQIREFNPTLIMISYSGRLHLEDTHFVQLTQELTKIANYKLLLFPNLTTAFCDEESTQTEDEKGDCEYDNFISDPRITAPLSQDPQLMESVHYEHWLQLFNKIGRFLKVSSGTYNLNRSLEQQPLVNKYKNQYILSYVDELMTVLGKEYSSIEKIRFHNHDLSILPKLFQENIRSIKKTFEHTVPKLYFDIYDILEYLLLDRRAAQQHKREQLLREYALDLQHYQDLIDLLHDQLLKKSNYEVSSIGLESMSENIEREKYKKMREVFNSLKESHLFEISSEKFEEKANIFFKTAHEDKEYSAIKEETESIHGLFETTFFLNPGKTNLKLYDSTKLLYRTEQMSRKNNKVPVLIMNNLTDGSSPHSFQNYYAQVDISSSGQGDKKTFEEKKCLATPIVFEEEDNLRKLFVLADWNYCESENFLILYWPSKHDFLTAFLLKLINRPYYPEILHDFYLSPKGTKQPVFQRVNVESQCDYSARMGCSAYEFQNKVYIFGGFYQRQKNYLELQHDIVTIDLTHPEKALPLQNLKHRLYSQQTFRQRQQQRLKANSFVRPRMEFQFFDREELYGQDGTMGESKAVIMLGGYGQNFLRPYSLLTCFYYQLHFHRGRSELESIQKRVIYNKAIPINTREVTKNLGVIKTNKKTKNGTLEAKKLTEPDSYALYRNSFRIEVKDGEEEFSYKFKYMFCEDDSKNFKHEIKKIQELRAEQFDSSSITIERHPTSRHLISLEKDTKKKWVTLRMEIPPERARKIEGAPKEVTLTHETIVHLDIWNSMIWAIVKHDKYTEGRSVLLEYNTKNLEALNFEQDDLSFITLSWVKQFQVDLTLHILIICNKNTIALLHGQKLSICQNVREFIVKRKKNEVPVSYEIKERERAVLRNQQTGCINTAFFKRRNKITAVDFIALADSPYFCINCQQIELSASNDLYRWAPSPTDDFNNAKYQLCLAKKTFLRLDQVRFLEFLKSSNEHYLVVEHNRRRYVCEVTRHSKVLQLEEEETFKIERETVEKGTLLLKTEDLYYDRDFD